MPSVNLHQDFIGVYDNALTSDECHFVIDAFNNVEANQVDAVQSSKLTYGSELNRKDFVVFAEPHIPEVQHLIDTRLRDCLDLYCEHHFVVQGMKAASLQVKLQRTPPKGGYHIWHCEQDCVEHASRILVWTIYLNDIPYNEGETEFLWQGVRVNPKAGRCVIWPAALTHYHRGNPVYTHDKYIATGWYTLI